MTAKSEIVDEDSVDVVLDPLFPNYMNFAIGVLCLEVQCRVNEPFDKRLYGSDGLQGTCCPETGAPDRSKTCPATGCGSTS